MRGTIPKKSLGLLLAVVVGCSSTALMDASEGEPGATGGGSGVPGGACGTCFESGCAWETDQCRGDPDCARWLLCAAKCGAESGGSLSASCLQGCDDPTTRSSLILKDAVLQCITNTGCCVEQSLLDAGSAGAGGDGPDGGSPYDDAIVGPGPKCHGETCDKCLLGIKEGLCTEGPACPEAIAACFHEADNEPAQCWAFLQTYGLCLRDASIPAQMPEECVVAVPSSSLSMTAAALQCAATHCPQCIPAERSECMACQLLNCPDAIETLMGNEEAQQLLWCLRGCDVDPNSTGCRAQCADTFPGGIPIVEPLGTCVGNACASQCPSF